MNPEAVARAYLASFGRADPAEIASHVAEDFVNDQVAALGRGCTGRDTYRERLVDFLADMVGLTYEVESLVADGPTVMVSYRLRASWRGTVPVDVRGAQRLEIHDGLITNRTDYWDAAGFLIQVDPDAARALSRFGIG